MQGCDFSLSSPRVARSAQPGAESFNPFGIENQCRRPKHLSRYSTENVEEPLFPFSVLSVCSCSKLLRHAAIQLGEHDPGEAEISAQKPTVVAKFHGQAVLQRRVLACLPAVLSSVGHAKEEALTKGEPTGGGANNFTANSIFATLTFRGP